MKLTVQETAEKYGVTIQAVTHLIRTGKLPHQSMGGRYFIDEEDVPLTWKHGKKGRWALAEVMMEDKQDV